MLEADAPFTVPSHFEGGDLYVGRWQRGKLTA